MTAIQRRFRLTQTVAGKHFLSDIPPSVYEHDPLQSPAGHQTKCWRYHADRQYISQKM